MNYNSDYEVRLATLEAMGGDVTKHYDSVYEIDLEILKLTEQGGGSTSAIEEVSELPDASENKEKLYRLSSDDNVYVSELKSRTSTTTNRLPDAQQIDKAYLYTASDGWVFNYKGSYTLLCADGSINGYGWHYYDAGDDINYFIITFDNNAENIQTNSSYYWCETYANIDFENRIIDVDGEGKPGISVSDVENSLSALDDSEFVIIPIPATYNAPESAQIGNAYLKEANAPNETFIYEGLDAHLVEIGEGNWYKWNAPNYSDFYTTKPASEIYYYNDEGTLYFDFDVYDSNLEYKYNDTVTEFYIPQLNAPDSEQVDNAYINDGGTEFLYKGQYTLLNEDNSIYASNVAGFFETGFMMFAKDWLPNEVYYQNIDSDDAINSDNPDEIELLPNNTIKTINGNAWHTSTFSFIFGDNGIELHPVKYQREETTEEWGWEKVATEQYVDTKIGEKENKIDFTIGLSQATPGAMPTLDLSNLNNVTTVGIYNIAIVSNVYGTGDEYEGTGKLAVVNLGEGNGIQQTLFLSSNYGMPKQECIVRMSMDGSTWSEQSMPNALIVPQGYETVIPYATYSATKINELISALETRIAALEGN